MAAVLVNTGEEPVVLSAKAAKKLLDRGDGDAALLYMALLRRRGGALLPRSLAGELRWEKGRIEQAEQVLRELDLVASPETPEPPGLGEKPEYQQEDVIMRLEDNLEFRDLVKQTETLLGKKLTTPDLKRLLGLYDYLGLPAHIIYQLVSHCAERISAQYGPGRRPTMKQIEQKGYAWARMDLYSQEAVEKYLKKDALRHTAYTPYMRVLNLGDRIPVDTEEQFLSAWMDAGFPPETVAIAYDRTVTRCHDFQWNYCNSILQRWDKAGLHTPGEVRAGDKSLTWNKEPKAAFGKGAGAGGADSAGGAGSAGGSGGVLRKYVRELHNEEEDSTRRDSGGPDGDRTAVRRPEHSGEAGLKRGPEYCAETKRKRGPEYGAEAKRKRGPEYDTETRRKRGPEYSRRQETERGGFASTPSGDRG